MHSQPARVFLAVQLLMGLAFLIISFFLLFVGTDEMPYYVGAAGLGAILFPLIGLGSRHDKLKQDGDGIRRFYLFPACITAAVIVLDVLLGKLLVVAITVAFASCTWMITLSLEEKIAASLKRFSVFLARCVFTFLIIFVSFMCINVPARAIITGVLEPWESIMDILEGISIVGIMIFMLLVSSYRIGGLASPLILVYMYFFPAQQLIDHGDEVPGALLPAYGVMASILLVLAANAGLGLGRCVSETIMLSKKGRSGLLGPWFPSLMKLMEGKLKTRKRATTRVLSLKHFIPPGQERALERGFLLTIFISAIVMPGFLPYFNVFNIPIQIVPRNDYQVKFNFWASPYIKDYPEDVRAELSRHEVNLDLTINRVTLGYVANLTELENAMPGVTYRLVIIPPSIDLLFDYVKEATDIILPYAENGTLKGWRGFCFDIEGYSFSDLGSNGSIEDEIAIWTRVFDFIEGKSINGKPIEMEAVNYAMELVDQAFDGDIDLQTLARHVSRVPDRFTTYAPMIYRCVFTGEKPYGSPMDLRRIWGTSYSIYTYLKTTLSSVPIGRMGIYLGITNASCYGRDLPQPERISWGNATGLGNLQRDVLICKSFGIKEVTFFLLQTYHVEGDYSNGGVFDTYGIDFLQVMNDTVNTNPPERFYIYYSKHDANLNRALMLDWALDFSRPPGMVLIGTVSCIATFLVSMHALLVRAFARKKGSERGKNSIQQGN